MKSSQQWIKSGGHTINLEYCQEICVHTPTASVYGWMMGNDSPHIEQSSFGFFGEEALDFLVKLAQYTGLDYSQEKIAIRTYIAEKKEISILDNSIPEGMNL
ncbi:hypothetical protein VB711_16970 [Cronbergia sp. UHCC 0137]|uniref:hypothetical protein n=1 Tax=Cronbergia sp. UHCC 0137 TaxID=3110239 RepID=UPI002B1F796A|nr:hypothetical protein [Cronbergia sp. UHCC 0137]MEA5619519.1 hypothetical protein [Cronbergia sp. UHCC 0137]